MSVASYAIPTHFWDKPGSSPEPLIRWMTQRCPFEQFSQQHSFSHCLITHYVLQPLNHPDGVLLGLLQYINVLHWKAQNWTQYPRYGLISTEVKNHFLQPTDYILPSMQLACFATRALPNHVQLGHTGLLLLACWFAVSRHAECTGVWHSFLPDAGLGAYLCWTSESSWQPINFSSLLRPHCLAALRSSTLTPPPPFFFLSYASMRRGWTEIGTNIMSV